MIKVVCDRNDDFVRLVRSLDRSYRDPAWYLQDYLVEYPDEQGSFYATNVNDLSDYVRRIREYYKAETTIKFIKNPPAINYTLMSKVIKAVTEDFEFQREDTQVLFVTTDTLDNDHATKFTVEESITIPNGSFISRSIVASILFTKCMLTKAPVRIYTKPVKFGGYTDYYNREVVNEYQLSESGWNLKLWTNPGDSPHYTNYVIETSSSLE